MNVHILNPTHRCQTEEDIFLGRLSEITGIEKVVTAGTTIHLTISNSTQQEALKQVEAICDTWDTSYQIIHT